MSEKLKLVPVEPTDEMLDRAVAFALNVSIGGKYRWTEYMRDLWARMVDAAPSDVAQAPSPNSYVKVGEAVTLTGAQLLEAFQFVAPDHPNDTDQLECEVTIQRGEGHEGLGTYCWITDYPEEGAIRLDGIPDTAAAVAPNESEEFAGVNDRLSVLLTGIASALKGTPEPNTAHSWHDLPELAAKLMCEVELHRAREAGELPELSTQHEERTALTDEQNSAIDAVCAKLTPTQVVDLGDHIQALRSIQWQARATHPTK